MSNRIEEHIYTTWAIGTKSQKFLVSGYVLETDCVVELTNKIKEGQIFSSLDAAKEVLVRINSLQAQHKLTFSTWTDGVQGKTFKAANLVLIRIQERVEFELTNVETPADVGEVLE
jgi:hypothetical protein